MSCSSLPIRGYAKENMLAFLSLLLPPLTPPNYVVILCDDLAIGDLSCYGSKLNQTPNIDRLAKEGMRFTDFYVASPACTPSRAALMTGCYPNRVSLPQVINPDSKIGLNPSEMTIPKMLKPLGYATGCFGKWHLGVKNLLPRAHGFDEFYGLPYSNDMWPKNGKNWPPLSWIENERPVEGINTMEDQNQITQRLTQRAMTFIEKNQRQPFFLYLAHPMPHVPIAASDKFRGKTGKGAYAETILDIDDSVGQIMKKLRSLHLEKNTVVVFTSDNGPWRPYGDHAGSPGIYREGKGTTFEAGMREPGIFWGPGRIPAGSVSRELATSMDLLPTFAKLSGGTLPAATIDGHDISPLITGVAGAKTPYKWFYYFWPDELQAVRSGNWKLHVPHNHRHQTQPAGTGGKPFGEVTERIELSLFDLSTDPSETTNVASQHPKVVARLLNMIDIGRKELGDSGTKTKGRGVRPPGRVTTG